MSYKQFWDTENKTIRPTISTISYDQTEIIKDIISLHCDNLPIECDPTYSKGNFYKKTGIVKPKHKFDLYPQTDDTFQCNAKNLPLGDKSIRSLMFDPPFIVGQGPAPPGKIRKRFGFFKDIDELWTFYNDCLNEFSRVLKDKGILIFKCQDTVDSHKNYFSHIEIMLQAINAEFYPKDLFILLAKSRAMSPRMLQNKQQHARKFHSYFWVFEKRTSPVKYGEVKI